MTPHSRLRNLDYTVCRECGTASNMIPCPTCTEREMKAQQQRRVVMVQHADGTTVADPAWLAEQHAATAAAAVEAIERASAAMVEAWHERIAGLSDEEIARIEAMTAETSRADDYDSSTEGPWQ